MARRPAKTVAVPFATLFHVVSEQIGSDDGYRDAADFLAQLGRAASEAAAVGKIGRRQHSRT